MVPHSPGRQKFSPTRFIFTVVALLLIFEAYNAGIPTIVARGTAATAGFAPALAAPWTLQGRVYAGETGTEPPTSTALSGVTVRLLCSDNADSQGSELANTTTDSSGFFALTTSRTCNYYNIIETDPAGYTSAGAASVGGTLKGSSGNWIQYAGNLDSKTLTGNKFWDRAASATCTSCADCTNKLNGSYGTVQLANDISTSASSCVLIGAGNVKFDGQGHSITSTYSGAESGYGISASGKTGITIQKFVISGFFYGISLESTSSSEISSNTATKNGTALYLNNQSDSNTIKDNQFSQNDIAVRMRASTSSNAFSGNVFCKQKTRDIYVHANTTATGNTLSGDKCDSVENWNGSGTLSKCSQTCTPTATVTCSASSACASALNGDYGTVTLGGSISIAGGLSVTGNNLTLDCNNYTLTGSNKTGTGITLNQRIGVNIKNCRITGFNTGIELRSAALTEIDNATITANNTGIALTNSDTAFPSQTNTIKNSSIKNNTNFGITLDNSKGNTIQTTDLSYNGRYALWVSGNCSHTVTGCKGGSGGSLYYAHDQTSLGTVPSGTYGLVYLCNVQGATLDTLTVNNGGANNDGIVLMDSGSTSIRKSKVTTAYGVWIENSTGIKVYENEVSSNQADGITLYNSLNAEVYDNTVTKNTGYGITISTGRGQVYENSVTSNSGGGIKVDSSPGATVRDNTVSGNYTTVQVKDSQGNVTSTYKSGDGIATKSSSGLTISGNTVEQNGYGLFFDGGTNSTVSQNEVCYNEGKDIYNNGSSYTGANNTCAVSYAWKDTGEKSDCNKQCIGWWNRKWGFSFVNPSLEDQSYERFSQTFGEDEVYYTAKVCIGIPFCIPFYKCWCGGYEADISTGIPDALAYIFFKAAWKDIAEHGECFGMSTKSLQFFYGDDFPANYDASAVQAKDLAEDSKLGNVSLRTRREISQGSQLSSELINSYLKDEWNHDNHAMAVLEKARKALAVRKPNMVSIKDGITKGHVMNYDTVVDVDANTSRIYLYDNNLPAFTTSVPTDPTNQTSGYPAIIIDKSKYGQPFGDNLWTYDRRDGVRVWGNNMIFDIPYSLSNRSDWTMPASMEGIANIIFGGDAIQGNTEDMNGRILGYDASGTEHEEIPGGMGLPIWSATNSDVPAILLVRPGDYNFNVFGKAGAYNQAVIGLNGAYVLENITATASTRDRLELRQVNSNPYHQELAFKTNGAEKAFNLSIFRGVDPKSDRRRFRIYNATVGSTDNVRFKVAPDSGSLTVANSGSRAFRFDLELQNEMVLSSNYVKGQMLQVVFQGLTVAPGQVQTVAPSDWSSLIKSTASVSTETCGDGVCKGGEDHVNCSADCPTKTCVQPKDDLRITSSTLLCGGEYELADAGQMGVLILDGSAIQLDCNGAKLKGSGSGVGIYAASSQGIELRNCSVTNYGTGIFLGSGTGGTMADSVLTGNQSWGLEVSAATNLKVTQNYISENGSGIHLVNTVGAQLSKNLVCSNTSSDILAAGATGSSGSNNACKLVSGWGDAIAGACTYGCGEQASSTTTTVTSTSTTIAGSTTTTTGGGTTIATTSTTTTTRVSTTTTTSIPSISPFILSVTPASGPSGGGVLVTIMGGNFTAGTVVRFAGQQASQVVVNSTTMLSVITPPGSPGAVDVTVQTADGTVTMTSGYTYVQGNVDARAPSIRYPVVYSAADPASCYWIADVSLAQEAAIGPWGIQIDLTAGAKMLDGGLNFGGAIDADGAGNAFAGFSVWNPFSEAQVVDVTLDAQAIATPGFQQRDLSLQVTFFQFLADGSKVKVGDDLLTSTTATVGVVSLRANKTLNPGFYTIEVRSLTGSPRAAFQLGATTHFVNRTGGGFQGGVVLGGYMMRNDNGQPISAFAGICISESQPVHFTTVRYTDASGSPVAGPLVLKIKNKGVAVYDSCADLSCLPSSLDEDINNVPPTRAGAFRENGLWPFMIGDLQISNFARGLPFRHPAAANNR